MKKKVVPKLRQEVKVRVDIVTSDDIKIYYTGKFQDFTARYIIHVLYPSLFHTRSERDPTSSVVPSLTTWAQINGSYRGQSYDVTY